MSKKIRLLGLAIIALTTFSGAPVLADGSCQFGSRAKLLDSNQNTFTGEVIAEAGGMLTIAWDHMNGALIHPSEHTGNYEASVITCRIPARGLRANVLDANDNIYDGFVIAKSKGEVTVAWDHLNGLPIHPSEHTEIYPASAITYNPVRAHVGMRAKLLDANQNIYEGKVMAEAGVNVSIAWDHVNGASINPREHSGIYQTSLITFLNR